MEYSCRIGRTLSETGVVFSNLSSISMAYPVLHETFTPSRVMPSWKNSAISLLLYQSSLLQAQTMTSFSSNLWGQQVWENIAPFINCSGHDLDLCCWRNTDPRVAILTHPSPLLSAVSRAANLSQLSIPWETVLSQPDVCPWEKALSQPLHCCCSLGASVCVTWVFWFLSPSPKVAGD